MFGDGATNIGYFHEGLNVSKAWNLRVLWVCENNKYGMGTSVERASAVSEIRQKAEGYGMANARVEGMDVMKVYEAAWLYDRGRECGIESAMARFAAARAALFAADRAIQTFGGAGYVSESGIERHWRNLRLNRIAPVTEEMTLNYIAQHDLGMPRSY